MEKTRLPNILFILSDQHSSLYLGSQKINSDQTKFTVSTPNLDRLCSEGVLYSNAICQNPLCVPSRSSLLSGRYSKNLGIYENRHIFSPNETTIPQLLSSAGYKTALIGKAHFNGEQWHGYQQRPYGDLLGQAHQSEYLRTGKTSESEHGLEDLLENSGPTNIPLPLTQTEICVAESAKWLQLFSESNKPFFLSVNFEKPHFPYRPPKKYYDKYAGKVSLPDSWHLSRWQQNASSLEDAVFPWMVPFVRKAFEVNGGWEHYGQRQHIHEQALAAYYGCVEWIDDAIGRIIDTLNFLNLRKNTIIVYASDHGEMAGSKGAWQKSVFFDESVKIPLIFSWPDQIRTNIVDDSLVELIDLFPTFCEFAGIPIPENLDGLSLVDNLCNGMSVKRNAAFSESVVLKVPEHAGCMIRTKKYKYNYYLIGSHELYNLENDPEEQENLIDNKNYQKIAAQLKKQIEDFWIPNEQTRRYFATPRVEKEKHFHLASNQFVCSEGTIVDVLP